MHQPFKLPTQIRRPRAPIRKLLHSILGAERWRPHFASGPSMSRKRISHTHCMFQEIGPYSGQPDFFPTISIPPMYVLWIVFENVAFSQIYIPPVWIGWEKLFFPLKTVKCASQKETRRPWMGLFVALSKFWMVIAVDIKKCSGPHSLDRVYFNSSSSNIYPRNGRQFKMHLVFMLHFLKRKVNPVFRLEISLKGNSNIKRAMVLDMGGRAHFL